MKYKNYSHALFFFMVFLTGTHLSGFDDSFDDLFSQDYSYIPSTPVSKAVPPPSDIINLLRQFGIIDLLKEDFFLKTFDLNKRDLLDYPLFMFPWEHHDCKTMGYQIFLNQTGQMRFSSSCAKINAYLSVSGNGFAEKFQAVLEEISRIEKSFDAKVALEILTLAEHFVVQERRLGVMFNYEQKIDNWHLWWYFPFYLRERNHFASQEVQDALQAILDPIFGVASQDEQDAFAVQHFINDKLGFGDFRFEFDHPVCCFPHFDARAGFFVTIPTAFGVANSLIGSNLQPPQVRPRLDIALLFDRDDPAIAAVNNAQVSSFLLAFLDNLSAMLLNTQLGNNGHFGIGFTFKTKNCLARFVPRPWAENIKLKSRMSVELQLPAVERRFFIQDNAKSLFAARNFEDDAQASSNYNFIVQQLTDRLFPFTGQAVVFPGVIGRSTTRGIYEGERWSMFLGTDTWIRSPERILEVYCPCVCNIAIDKAQRKMGYQSKLMGGVAFHHCTDERDYAFSLNADMTTLSAGLGDDYMITFNIDVNF